MKNDNVKFIVAVIVAVFLSSFFNALASGTLFDSSEVVYDNSSTNLNQTTVQGAIDDLYAAATDYNNLSSRVTSLESNFGDIFRIYGNSNSTDVGVRIYDSNDKLRSGFVFNDSNNATSILSLDSTGAWGNFGTLNMYGSNIVLNASADVNMNANNIKANGKKVLTSNIESCTFTHNTANVSNKGTTYCIKYNDICILNISMEVKPFTNWQYYVLGTLNVKSKNEFWSVYTPQGSSGHNTGDLIIGTNLDTVSANPRGHVFSANDWIRGQLVFLCEYK